MSRLLPLIVLILPGAAWRATQPLAVTALSEGYRHFGILFWNTSLGALILGAVWLLGRTGGLTHVQPRPKAILVAPPEERQSGLT